MVKARRSGSPAAREHPRPLTSLIFIRVTPDHTSQWSIYPTRTLYVQFLTYTIYPRQTARKRFLLQWGNKCVNNLRSRLVALSRHHCSPFPMQKQQRSKQYSCPTLSFDEIISNFFSWGFSISHEQLHRPSQEFVSSIYWICLNLVKDLSQDGLADAAAATTVQREHLVGTLL